MEESLDYLATHTLLQPFIHQVGGHSSMLCLDEKTVCKPVVEREKLFYETLPETLKPFVPIYYGIIKVSLLQDGDYISLMATNPVNYDPKPSSSLRRMKLRRSGSVEEVGVSSVFESDSVSGAMNPWVNKCLKEYITNLTVRLEEQRQPLNFIVLENLTWRFNHPCILDLKMGTRQHGDNDSLAKRQSKMVKVISTTSAKLGVRIGGMQVYQASTGKFKCHNKMYGRTLTTSGFQKALRSFLHDGVCLRINVLPPLIRRLEHLLEALSHLESTRLYTTSLLLLYDGENTACDPSNGNTNNSDRPEVQEEEQRKRGERAGSVDRQSDTLRPSGEDFRYRSTSCNNKDRKQPVEIKDQEPLTDVRVIDFAHSTHSGMEDKVVYSGPDSGFIFGLTNLIQFLKAILLDSQ